MGKSKSYTARPSDITPEWYLVDAEGQTLGRLAANVARILRGKHKPTYTPHLNTGDHVIVINARGIRVTGKKVTEKIYTSYTGYPGGLRKVAYGDQLVKHPTFPFQHAVAGMLQHGTLGKAQLSRLKIYTGEAHPHVAQRPKPIKFGARGEIEVIG
ncbi:MAG: 50S ribosomal protein L13 [Candidatus Dormibacteraeota bacterium]|nr:50S ribosomal protein L13 [Candidatus Dormibacteraeota bacterium]